MIYFSKLRQIPFIIKSTGGSSTPGNEITPKIPAVIPKHSISSTDDKSQPDNHQ